MMKPLENRGVSETPMVGPLESGGVSETPIDHVSVNSRSSSSSSSHGDDQPKSLLERVMSCCGVCRKSSETELESISVESSSPSPEGSTRSSPV